MLRALVFGGSGTVGSEVVRRLAREDVPSTITYHRSRAKAEKLVVECGATPIALDLADPVAVRSCVRGLADSPEPPTVFVHCAARLGPAASAEVDDAAWREVHAVNVHSAFVACQELAPAWSRLGRGEVVLVGALDRGQALPVPAAFAATQGALAGLAMALAKELGPSGVRVNFVALGPLAEGFSRGLDAKLLDDYRSFSALRRLGTPAEAAEVIAWLALKNTYVSGKVVPANGGI